VFRRSTIILLGNLLWVSLICAQTRDAGRQPLLPSEVAPTETDDNGARLIDLHLQARGGVETLLRIQSLDFRGELREGKTTWNRRWRWDDPNAFHLEQWREHLGRDYRTVWATDGRETWTQELGPEEKRERSLEGSAEKAFFWEATQEALIFRHLLEWREAGHIMAFDGTRRYNGHEVYIVKAKLKDGPIVYYYLDKENFLLRAIGYRQRFGNTEANVDLIPTGAQKMNGIVVETGWEWQVEGRVFRRLTYKRQELSLRPAPDFTLFEKPKRREVWLGSGGAHERP
jgi:hypothetical protein